MFSQVFDIIKTVEEETRELFDEKHPDKEYSLNLEEYEETEWIKREN